MGMQATVNMPVSVTLAEKAAKALGYHEQTALEPYARHWRPLTLPKLTKWMLTPEIIAFPREMVLQWTTGRVVFYTDDIRCTENQNLNDCVLSNVSIYGEPPEDQMENVLASWDEFPSIVRCYEGKKQWYARHPEYKAHLAGKKQKKVHASQVESPQ